MINRDEIPDRLMRPPCFNRENTMRVRLIFILLIGLLIAGQTFAADGTDLQVKSTRKDAIVAVERVIDDGRVMLSVSDSAKNPIFGLTVSDFVVTAEGRTARITSVKPIEESLDVPRNIVMVLDNSRSMRVRNAIDPLLAGVDELLKIVRPIDQVQVVVFDGDAKVNMGGRDLRVRIFKSSDSIDIKNFVTEAYRDRLTLTTRLYEAMLAGLEIVRMMPENEPRFMVVFSDGEDLHSAYDQTDVTSAAKGMGLFHAYAIDYMPGEQKDRFLSEFTDANHGAIWKATSETTLVPIFQNVASKMLYYYVVSYLFPTTGSLEVTPASLTIDDVVVADAPAVSRMDVSTLTLRPEVDTAYGISSWKAALVNSSGTLAMQTGEGAPAAEIVFPVKKEDVGRVSDGGDITATVEVTDRKGQTTVLTALPVKVSYFKTTGGLSVAPSSLTIEEVKTIDSSPMLGHIYFAKDSAEIPEQYIRLAGTAETETFDEQRFRDTIEKYYQVLNIVGKRLNDHPQAKISLIGCNSNTGKEKGNKKLSAARADAVRDYLQTVWSIAPERITVDARNLPEIPTSGRLEEGQAENRRVEIRPDDPAILAPVRSTYLSASIDAPALTLRPTVNAPHGIARWTVAVANTAGSLGDLSGEGDLPAEIKVPLQNNNLNEMGTAGDIKVAMTVTDRKGQELALSTEPVKVNFIQTSQRLAQKQDFRVREKYALILFDFDSDAISASNEEIVNKIVARIKELPGATAEIVGHTDNIGKEDYNIKLSQRRASSVNKLLTAAFGEGAEEHIRHSGVGPNEPLYDNTTPEARAFNRTVTITLEYMAND